MKTQEYVKIRSKKCDKWYMFPIIQKIFVKKYHSQGFVYITKHWTGDYPVHMSSTIKWLDKFIIESTSEKDANNLAFNFLREKYPDYINYINLY